MSEPTAELPSRRLLAARLRGWRLAAVGVAAVVVAGLAVGLPLGLTGGPANPPLASARGLFPDHVQAGAAGSPVRLRLAAAAAQLPGRRSFTWRVPALPGVGGLYDRCTGRIAIWIHGSESSTGPCPHGLGWITIFDGGLQHALQITVRVSARQPDRWGIAAYQAAPMHAGS